jgi:hypothetical protein
MSTAVKIPELIRSKRMVSGVIPICSGRDKRADPMMFRNVVLLRTDKTEALNR